MTITCPKSIQGVPYRWFTKPLTTSQVDGKTYKAGGKVAILQCPVPGWSDVMVFQPDDEDWWDNLPSDVAIRAAIRGPARNGNDLIGYALPLRNQPSELQEHIKGLQPQQVKPPRQVELSLTPKPRLQKRQKDRRPSGSNDDALVGLLELAARDRNCKVYQLVDELLWQAVQEGKLQ